jgi:hypothetical protein
MRLRIPSVAAGGSLDFHLNDGDDGGTDATATITEFASPGGPESPSLQWLRTGGQHRRGVALAGRGTVAAVEPLFVLVHSPSVGPATWAPVAAELARRGYDAVVPSLLEIGAGEPPAWRRVAAAVTDALAGIPAYRPVILVAHSNAGLFVPVIRAALRQPVAASVFVDAALPARGGTTPVAEAEFLDFLRGLAGPDGRLPRWTDWWDDADVAPMFPDPRTRKVVTEEQPRLPLSYYEQAVPVPDGWADHPCVYVVFGPAYEAAATEAGARGWPVRHLPGEHLHQLVDPGAVTDVLVSAAEAGR